MAIYKTYKEYIMNNYPHIRDHLKFKCGQAFGKGERLFFFDVEDTNRRKTKTCELENLAIT